MNNEMACSILFSGGTDSLCAAAVAAEKYQRIHLLTFFDLSNKNSPMPVNSARLLRQKFPERDIRHFSIDTDPIVRHLSYDRYFSNLRRYKLLLTANCAFTSMSWHIATVLHNKNNNISVAADGLTREMMHLPGHMDSFIEVMKGFYQRFDMKYENPVREWAVPEEQTLEDRFIIDRHGFLFPSEEEKSVRTTGQYLFDLGIFDRPNIKGSSLDRSLQHDCYPFVLYNIMLFWVYLNFMPMQQFEGRLMTMVKDKIESFQLLLEQSGTQVGDLQEFYQAEELNA